MQHCNYCGQIIDSNAAICKNCGHVFHLPDRPKEITAAAIFCFVLGGYTFSSILRGLIYEIQQMKHGLGGINMNNLLSLINSYLLPIVIIGLLIYCGFSLIRLRKSAFSTYIGAGSLLVLVWLVNLIIIFLGFSRPRNWATFLAGILVEASLLIVFGILIYKKKDYLLI